MVFGLGPGNRCPHILVFSVLILITLGMVMLASTSAFQANVDADDLYFEVKRQALWGVAGISVALFFAQIDYRRIQNWIWPVYAVAAVLLIACFIPAIGQEINGERRWINSAFIGINFRVQPSEFAKLVLIATLATWFARYSNSIHDVRLGFLFPTVIAGFILALIAAEVDIGTTAVLTGVVFALMFIAGCNRRLLFGGAIAATLGLATLVALVPGRMTRVMAILKPEEHEHGVGLQQNMAKLALGSGGVDGMGLGEGSLKMLYMPFAHTDFIFPMIGEELGLVGTLTVLACFAGFAWSGTVISQRAPDSFGRLLGIGIVLCVSIQAALNIAVTTAVFPNTGLPLPFVSYGGSNLICSLMGVGILLSIHRQSPKSFSPHSDAVFAPRI
tara:strand:+ start:18821 stop:19984 length:1164 start_codon:yes stop_codon:yes gene_type:complete